MKLFVLFAIVFGVVALNLAAPTNSTTTDAKKLQAIEKEKELRDLISVAVNFLSEPMNESIITDIHSKTEENSLPTAKDLHEEQERERFLKDIEMNSVIP